MGNIDIIDVLASKLLTYDRVKIGDFTNVSIFEHFFVKLNFSEKRTVVFTEKMGIFGFSREFNFSAFIQLT